MRSELAAIGIGRAIASSRRNAEYRRARSPFAIHSAASRTAVEEVRAEVMAGA